MKGEVDTKDLPLLWHILSDDLRLGYGDGRQVVIGQPLSVEGPISPCWRGLHASRRLYDCLEFAKGNVICKVRLGGSYAIDDGDKLVAYERTVVDMLSLEDSQRVLRTFARWTARSVRHLLNSHIDSVAGNAYQATVAAECLSPILAARRAASNALLALATDAWLSDSFASDAWNKIAAQQEQVLTALAEAMFKRKEKMRVKQQN